MTKAVNAKWEKVSSEMMKMMLQLEQVLSTQLKSFQ